MIWHMQSRASSQSREPKVPPPPKTSQVRPGEQLQHYYEVQQQQENR